MSDKKEFEFKDTLNLPQTTLAMRANAAVRELEIQDFWEERKIYEKNLAQRDIEKNLCFMTVRRILVLLKSI